MDFGTLLSVAQKNEKKHAPKACYQTKFTPPKKENKQSKSLSDNIKKFLARKEEEERQKALEEKKKKENLLSMRDQKAQNRINKHLKVCKAANKAVLADAIDTENTAVTLAGPSQCDEDDYGYVSQEASAFYNKLMNKYSNLPPEKPLFSNDGKKTVKDIASTKDRVKQALKQQELEESLPHRRKRKHKELESDGKQIKEVNDEVDDRQRDREREKEAEQEEKPKVKKKSMPPPLDFSTLLKLAEKKQFEPIKIEPKPKPKEEPERLMTKKQMKEYAKEKEWREKKEQRSRNPEGISSKPVQSSSDSSKTNSIKFTKLSNSKPATEVSQEKTVPKLPAITKKLSDKPIDKSNALSKPVEKSNVLSKPIEKSSTLSKSKDKSNYANKYVEKSNGIAKSTEKTNGSYRNQVPKVSEKDAIAEERKKLEEEKRKLEEMRRLIEEEKKKLNMDKSKKIEESKVNNSQSQKFLGNKIKDAKNSSTSQSLKSGPSNVTPTNGVKSRPFPPSDVKSRQFPPADVKPRQFPPADVRPRQFPPPDVRTSKQKSKLKVNKRRIYDTDDEDYDSEMDDFIDDGPQEDGHDVSKYISEIFGYDKNKYRDLDDDDDAAMESNFAQQLKEEFVSTKIGIMEDLEDIRQEALEKKRKALLKNKKVRKV